MRMNLPGASGAVVLSKSIGPGRERLEYMLDADTIFTFQHFKAINPTLEVGGWVLCEAFPLFPLAATIPSVLEE